MFSPIPLCGSAKSFDERQERRSREQECKERGGAAPTEDAYQPMTLRF